MKFNKLFLLPLFIFIFFSCATTPVKDIDDPEKKDDKPEKEVSEEQAVPDLDESDEELDDEKKKEEREKKEDRYFDGNVYRGPALKDFQDGLEKYFSEGCESAVARWESAVKRDPRRVEIAFNIALCYERMGDAEKSREWYMRSFKGNNNFMRPLYNYSLSLGDKLNEKVPELTKLVAKTEDKVLKNNFLSWLNIQVRNFDNAEKYAKAALKLDEQNVDAVINLATIYYSNDMLELADMALGIAEQWDSDDFRLHRLYGFLKFDMGKKGEAAEHFQRAVRLNPELSEVRNMLAVLAMEIEDYNTAKEQLEFVLKISPDFNAAKINLAMAYKGLEKYKESNDILMGLLNSPDLTEPDKKKVLFNLGILYLDADVDGEGKTDRFDLSTDYLKKYLEMIKGDSNFRQQKVIVDEYISEAATKKRSLEMMIAMRERQAARQKALEEEHKLFLKMKEEAFKNAVSKDTVEVWREYLDKYPVIDADDKFSNAAQARLKELEKESTEHEDTDDVPEKSEEKEAEEHDEISGGPDDAEEGEP